MTPPRPSKLTVLVLLLVIGLGALLWATVPALQPANGQSGNLAADLPPGALLTIESPDFAGLLHAWTSSPEEQAWLKSANYSAFAHSRLLPRLAEAQATFAGSAGVPLGAAFLEQIAGSESIFAWYGIGSLEFLYITHLPPDRMAQIDLLKQRAHFSQRTVGETNFYVRTGSDCGDQAQGQSCTVAFATRGDLLVLATREDLIANALMLMQSAGPSMVQEGWFAAASSAGPAQHGELHMLLDLQRLTRTPQFRTYWVQRNVTDTRRFRAAVVDLYREPGRFREERTLLPMAANPSEPDQPDVSPLESMVPERAGFYRITAQPSAAAILTSLEEKVLTRTTSSASAGSASPYANLSPPEAGSASDFETRIDAPAFVPEPPEAALAPLKQVLATASITAMATIDRTDPPAAGGLFVPIHAAVILRRQGAWDADALASSLVEATGAKLSAGKLGLAWKPVRSAAGSYYAMSAAQPIALAVLGDTAIVATGSALMEDILRRRRTGTPQPDFAMQIAEFRPAQERASFLRLTSALDAPEAPQGGATETGAQTSPAFFRDNLGSLTQTFSSLALERFLERQEGTLIRQTVTYTWTGR